MEAYIPPTHITPHGGTGAVLTNLAPACATYYIMGVLVQLDGTTMYRRALLPVLLFLMTKSMLCLELSEENLQQAYFNGLLSFLISVFSMRATAWTFAQETYRRSLLGVMTNVSEGRLPTSPLQAIWDACDLCINFRGIGWNWSRLRQTPNAMPDSRSKSSFLLSTVAHIVFYTLALDTAVKSGRAFNPTSEPSLQVQGRPLHMVATSVILLTLVYCTIELHYHCMTLVGVAIFDQTPAQWPPVFDAPWQSTSLGEFWGRRWHQLLRDCFISLGSRVGRSGASRGEKGSKRRVLYILGAFFVSGVFHDLSIRYTLGKGGDSMSSIVFFVMQGVGVIIERAFTSKFRCTDHRLLGRFWVAFWLLVWGMPMAVTWARLGLFEARMF